MRDNPDRSALCVLETRDLTVTYGGRPPVRAVRGVSLSLARSQARRIQMVFQDPYASLNPRLTARQTVTEMLRVHRLRPENQIAEQAPAAPQTALAGLIGAGL